MARYRSSGGGGSNDAADLTWENGTQSEVTDGASAIAFHFDTDTAWSLGDVLSVTNLGADMFKVSQFGQVTATNGSSSVFLDPFNGLVQFSPANSNAVRVGRGAGREIEISAPSSFEILIGANTAANGISMRPNAQTGDAQASKLDLKGGDARSTATTFIIGGTLFLEGGEGASGSSGNADGGDVEISGGQEYGTGNVGNILMASLPTSDPSVAGALWNNSTVLTVSAG